MSTNLPSSWIRRALAVALTLSAVACGVDATDAQDGDGDPASASDADAEIVGTTSAELVSAASCTATHDGGKWCCAVIFKKLRCWKVDPPPPPDTIYTFY